MSSVSVVIPAYNCQQYVAIAIRSALTQENIHEVIVVDDGSTDETGAIASQLTHPKLRYTRQQNKGVSAARNQGISLATSPLIAFLDADDYFLPGKLAQQAALFAANPQLGLVQSGWQQVDSLGQLICQVTPWEEAPELTLENWLRFKPVLPSALMVQRQWLLDVGGFDPQLQAAEDIDLVSRLALKGCQSSWLKQVAVSYRQHSGSAMGDGSVQARDLSKFLEKFFQQPDLPAAARMMEPSVRYHTLLWAAWYLHHTGHPAQMVTYLKRAWRYSPYLPVGTLIHWADSFAGFAARANQPIDKAALIGSDNWQKMVAWLLSQTRAV